MGKFSSFLTRAKSFDVTPSDGEIGIMAQQVSNYMELQGDGEIPAQFAETDEVQTIGNVTADDGTYTLTITLENGTSFTTAAIDHDDNAAAIEAAIDAANGALAAGTINVTGGPIDTAPVVLTFDGAGVAGTKPGLTVVGNSLLASAVPADDPEVEVTTEGQPDREGYAILVGLGVLDAANVPLYGQTTDDLEAGENLLNVKPWFIRNVSKEISIQESNPDIESMINTAAIGRNRG